MTVYEALLGALARPSTRTLTTEWLQESFCPHRPPMDTTWPTPQVFLQARLLLQRLPHRQQVVCSLTAAEIALPLWEAWADDRDIAAMPRNAVVAVLRWLAGEAGTAELHRAMDGAVKASEAAGRESSAREGRDAAIAYAARLAAEATDQAVYAASCSPTADSMVRADRAAQAVAKGARAITHYHQAHGHSYDESCARFLARWWDRCRCRLAVRDVDSADLYW